MLGSLFAIVGLGLIGTSTLPPNNATSSLLSENIEALSSDADIESQVSYGCKYNNVAGKWICTWYNKGSSCSGCKKPK